MPTKTKTKTVTSPIEKRETPSPVSLEENDRLEIIAGRIEILQRTAFREIAALLRGARDISL